MASDKLLGKPDEMLDGKQLNRVSILGQVVQSWAKITQVSLKSDLRSENFKRKFVTIIFVYNLKTECPSKNKENKNLTLGEC